MTVEFYGPTVRAVAEINKLLGLHATGREQDWEFEFADPTRIQEMLNLLEHENIDDECRSALALLMIASMEEATALEPRDEARAASWFSLNERVRKQMHFYWIDLDRTANAESTARVLGVT